MAIISNLKQNPVY